MVQALDHVHSIPPEDSDKLLIPCRPQQLLVIGGRNARLYILQHLHHEGVEVV